MENVITRYCPVFVRRLWCRLAVIYTALAFCALMVLFMMLGSLNAYNDFHASITLENVEQRVDSETITIIQAIRASNNNEWLSKARDNIKEKLSNIEHGSGVSLYRITSSSIPEVYIQISDSKEQLLIHDLGTLPDNVVDIFTRQTNNPAAIRSVKWLPENDHIWVDMPLMAGDEFVGRLRVLFVAKFDFWVQLQTMINFFLAAWAMMLVISVPIGIACGLVAARYVTGQLQKMNDITESWRQGNFKVRIALPTDDVLIRHSQHLNGMAQDLELFFNLKQSIAINDERNRVARELHDTVKQKLFALGLQLATAKVQPAVMEAAGNHILEAETITREAQYDLMEIITQLRPSGSGEASLYQRIAMTTDDFMRRFDVSIELNHSESVECEAQAEHNVLRIVQESLMNAVRHGNATNITITSQACERRTLLTISDNGNGFDTSQKTPGFGITSMRDRASKLPKGAFEIKTAIGEGTQIRLSWENQS